jgi:transcriptional regulator
VSVYVDHAFSAGDWGRWTGGGHLQADSTDELHAFAARLGLRREWFQSRVRRPEKDHYDLTRAGRERALELGAIAEDVRTGSRRRRAIRQATGAYWPDMRHNPKHATNDADVVRRLIRENPWATLVSTNDGELIASHYPILLDEDVPGLTVLTHVGRPDEKLHGFADDRELLLIVQGRHGYVSPSWYAPGATRAPTWNFSVAHCYGVPQILDEQENLRVLTRLVEHFERHVERPALLDPDYGAKLATGTVGLRLPITRFVCKVKLSQDKDPISRRQAIAALRAPGPYHNPELAEEMERARGDVTG